MHESLGEIRAAGERAASVTQQLLTFSRKQITSVSVMDLNRVVSESHQLHRRLIGEDLKLITRLHSGPITVLADSSHVGQVLITSFVIAHVCSKRANSKCLRRALW